MHRVDHKVSNHRGPRFTAPGLNLSVKMPPFETFVGSAAAFCTTISYVPQLRKAWATGETSDISLKMLALLATGLALWIVYGLMKADVVIMAANAISLTLLLCIVAIKLRSDESSERISSSR